MKTSIIIVAIGLSNLGFSQSMKQVDSVANVLCEKLKEIDVKDDKQKLNTLYRDHLYPYMAKLDPSKVEQIGTQVYYRLQRGCVEFRELLDKIDPPKENPNRKTEKPISKISSSDLEEFKNQKEFYYFEVLGDTTTVSMNGGFWTDYFTDKTYSKLTYEWLSDSEFELVFIESNNDLRGNFSVEGDNYTYEVLNKKNGYYSLSVNIPGQEVYETIKLYY